MSVEIESLLDLAIFCAELVRQGVGFHASRAYDGGPWRVTFTGAF